MKRINIVVMGLIACLAIVFFSPASQAGKVMKLDFGDPVGGPPTVPVRMGLDFFCNEVASRTNGQILIKYHPKTLVSNEAKAMDMCRTGAIAFTQPGAAMGSYLPVTQAFSLPFLYKDAKHFYSVANGPIGKEMEAEIEKKYNLKVVFWFDWGFRQFANKKRPIEKPEDLKGLKLRVLQGKVYADTVNAFGGSAVPMSWAETITAIQQGVVDGLDLGTANIVTYKVYEVIKYVSITNHVNTACAVFVNLDVWKQFTPEQQKIILEAGQEAAEFIRLYMRAKDLSGESELRNKGIKVTHPDLTPFREIAIKEVYPKYYDKVGKDKIDRILNAK